MLRQASIQSNLYESENEDFLGSEHFTTGFVKTYVRDNILDINPELL